MRFCRDGQACSHHSYHPCQLFSICRSSCCGTTASLDLLDRIRAGYFQLVCFLPPTATWHSSSELSDPPQLRSRRSPFGLDEPDPVASQHVLNCNVCCDCSAWISEQAATCSQCRLILAFPEDVGGHASDGPASIWSCHEYQMLERLHEAERGAACLCQLSSADHRGPWKVVSDIPNLLARLSPAWPSLQLTDSRLVLRSASKVLPLCVSAQVYKRSRVCHSSQLGRRSFDEEALFL